MLERTLKSSRLFQVFEKLHVDFRKKSSMGKDMADGDEVNPIKVRSGLFALITARLQDAHQIAVKGQAANVGTADVNGLIIELRSMFDEINVQLDAIELMNNLKHPLLGR